MLAFCHLQREKVIFAEGKNVHYLFKKKLIEDPCIYIFTFCINKV